jgi:hypothetical protein
MTHWVQCAESSRDRAGFCQWYLCVGSPPHGRIVGEVVVQDPEGVHTYYAELTNGRGLRYFTNVEDAKSWLWSFYRLDTA